MPNKGHTRKCNRCMKKTVVLARNFTPDKRDQYRCGNCGNTFTEGKNENAKQG